MQWGSIADWVSGLGSFVAVITALYLARDTNRIKLTGYCGIRLIVGASISRQELIYLSVTNIGYRTVIINNIGMRVGRFKKRHAIIPLDKDIHSDGIPVSIEDGQIARWGIPLVGERKWIKDLVDGFVMSEYDARTLRLLVFTTHGTDKVIKPVHRVSCADCWFTTHGTDKVIKPETTLVEEIIKTLKAKNTE